MPWTPEDWEGLLEVDTRPTHTDAADAALLDILQRIPGTGSMTVADFGSATHSRLPLLASHFGDVLAVSDAESSARSQAPTGHAVGDNVRHADARFSDLSHFAGTIGVALAMDVPKLLDGACLDRFVEQLHSVLIEGGIVLLGVPAAKRIGGPVELYLGQRDLKPRERKQGPRRINRDRYHEVEFQYRLRRAGFQGVRIQRFDNDEETGGTLLSMAVRRTLN